MRITVISDLGQAPPKSKFVAATRILTGDGKPYSGVPVQVSFEAQPDRYVTTVKSDAEGYVFYPAPVYGAKIVFSPVPTEGHYFHPFDVVHRTFSAIQTSDFDPEKVVPFTEVAGAPFLWKPYLIGGGVLVAAYYLWSNWDELTK